MPSCRLSVIASASRRDDALLDDVVAEASARCGGLAGSLLGLLVREQAGLDQHLAEALA